MREKRVFIKPLNAICIPEIIDFKNKKITVSVNWLNEDWNISKNFQFDEVEFMEEIGLKDLDNTKIFSSDILEDIRDQNIGEVVYINHTASFEIRETSGELYSLDIDNMKYYKIKGNKFLNPELLNY